MDKKTLDFTEQFGDWRSEKLLELAKTISETIPDAKDEIKWGVPVWSGNKMIVAISGFKNHIKINFLYGADLPQAKDKDTFNSGLDSKQHRSIDYKETDKIDLTKIKNLLESAWSHDKI